MAVILLVRHGQASTGSADHGLSGTGRLQAEALGTAFSRHGLSVTRMVSGRLDRQQQTARCTRGAAKWSTPAEVDEAWNEFDHEDVVAAHRTVDTPDAEPLDRAIPRWSSGLHDQDYAEPFPAFTKRVENALRTLAAESAPGESAVVFTSAGVIGWVAASLLGGGEPQWSALNRVAVNSGVTKVVVGSRGSTLVTFNEHSHLPPQLVTYR